MRQGIIKEIVKRLIRRKISELRHVSFLRQQAVDLQFPIERGARQTEDLGRLIDLAVRDGRIKRGQLLLLEAFGGGFTWGSALVRY